MQINYVIHSPGLWRESCPKFWLQMAVSRTQNQGHSFSCTNFSLRQWIQVSLAIACICGHISKLRAPLIFNLKKISYRLSKICYRACSFCWPKRDFEKKLFTILFTFTKEKFMQELFALHVRWLRLSTSLSFNPLSSKSFSQLRPHYCLISDTVLLLQYIFFMRKWL